MKFTLLIPLLLVSLLVGCSTPTPAYKVSIPNIQTLKNNNSANIGVGDFSAQSTANDSSIVVRASSMVSSKGTFASYVQDALTQELIDAKLFDPKSNIQVTAILIKNNISAASLVTNSAEIEARFVVKRDGNIVFDKAKYAQTQWDSSFLGAVAIPRARENYPGVVAELFKVLYADEAFLTAIKK